MALKHVVRWSDRGTCKYVNASTLTMADRTSAKSGLFFCAICGQSVSVAGGTEREIHFKHSKGDENKNCEERSSRGQYLVYSPPTGIILPLKLIITQDSFSLNIGMLSILKEYAKNLSDRRFVIHPYYSGYNSDSCFDFDRISSQGITYFPVKEVAPQYEVRFKNSEHVSDDWPIWVDGVEQWAIFDKQTGRKLSQSADVQVGRWYYLLIQNKYQVETNPSIQCHKIYGRQDWQIFEIRAIKQDRRAFDFFVQYNCFLNSQPIAAFPLWPVHIKSSCIIHHCAGQPIYMFFRGDVTTRTSPREKIEELFSSSDNSGCKLLKIQSQERQQLVSFGRFNTPLKYVYLWEDTLEQQAKLPSCSVTDSKKQPQNAGILFHLPARRELLIRGSADGFAEQWQGDFLLKKLELTGGGECRLGNIQYGQTILVFQGLDCVWKAEYKRKPGNESGLQDRELLQMLLQCDGREIPVPHSLGSIAQKLEGFDLVKKWLYKIIREGKITEKALGILKSQVRK